MLPFCGQKKDFFRSLRKGVPGVYTYFLGCEGFIWVYMPPQPVRYLGEPPLVLWRHWWKFVKITIFPQKHPYDRIFWWSKMSLGVRSTPQNFLRVNEGPKPAPNFFGKRHHVAWILEPLDPKIAYFGRKIADCRIFCTPKCALWVRTTPQKIFLP